MSTVLSAGLVPVSGFGPKGIVLCFIAFKLNELS
jgi:hypothetical protein